jgi:hypothetical protein
MNVVKFFYDCPTCGNEQEVQITPPIPAHISGPPESCYPAEGGEIEAGGTCESCGLEFDEGLLIEKCEATIRDRIESIEEQRGEDQIERLRELRDERGEIDK